MAKEIFVIYNNVTGFIDGGSGKIDRERDLANADGSTMLERIPEILIKDPDRVVTYLPDQDLPDSQKQKISLSTGNIINLTASDKQTIKDTMPKTEIDLLKERIDTLEKAPAQL